jgi:hypothetical protein
MPWSVILLIIALICFAITAAGFDHAKFGQVRMVALGLAFATLSVVVSAV